MNKLIFAYYLLIIPCLISCVNKDSNSTLSVNLLDFEVKNLSDLEYPDNPDIGFRSKNYQTDFFEEGKIEDTSKSFHYNFTFTTIKSDTIFLNNINLSEFIPTIPEQIKTNEYMCYISFINQEWNRNQVMFGAGEFSSAISEIVRVDLARNCLNAYLWEIIVYINEDGKVLPYAHGWFDFPHDLYAQLFEKKNNIPFNKYKPALENWIDPESKKVNLNLLREVVDTLNLIVFDNSDQMYLTKGEQKKKFKEIIYPTTVLSMRDLQSDSSTFATFSPPGKYDKTNPRKTELGRINKLLEANLYKIKTISADGPLFEIQLTFSHRTNDTKTTLIIGGLDFEMFPILKDNEAHDGWKNSMGIGNHTFYESYQEHQSIQSKNSSYYALLLDENGKWLDSHQVGIDGPLFHFSDDKKKLLNLQLLSFERHAIVGHYKLDLN